MEDFNNFIKISDLVQKLLSDLPSDVAREAVKNIKAKIQANGQVKSGDMLNSVHVDEGSTNTPVQVIVGASYAVYQNYGTHFQPPRPFFEPGIDQTQAYLDEQIASIAKKVEAGNG